MNVISFCYDKDYYDFVSVTKENYYYEKVSNIELLQNYLIIDNIYPFLTHKTQDYIYNKINEIIKQKIVIRVPYDKKFLVGKAICYNENKNCSFVLLSRNYFLI